MSILFCGKSHFAEAGPERCQYDYRHGDGTPFSCVAVSLEAARERRERWLSGRNAGIA
ncbi:MAG: DUF3873 domain-containing protein [Desulfovibrio sp.]|jgi:hypothetical protein|nr:DUF3873 domain-containing protein [Desulfovibrio sp.]